MKLSHNKILFCAGIVILMAAATASAQLEVVTNNAANVGNILYPTCVQAGEYGLRTTTVNGVNSAMFVEAGASVGVNNETVFRAQFWFNPSTMDIRHGRRHFIASSTPGSTSKQLSPFRTGFFKNAFTGERKVNINCKVNCTNPTCPNAATTKISLGSAPGWSLIQIEWAQNSGPGVFDGVCRISVIAGIGAGESRQANITNLQYNIGSIKMGFLGGVVIDPQSTGEHCYDEFSSFRTLAP